MDQDLYTPPKSEPDSVCLPKRQRKWLKILALLMFAGPIWGLIGQKWAMIGAFEQLRSSVGADPAALADVINRSMYIGLVGLVVGLIGAILVLVEINHFKNRQVWFTWLAGMLSLLWCFILPPWGVLVIFVGIVITIFCHKLRFQSSSELH